MSFDHLAPIYRPLELIAAGRVMQKARTAFLTRCTHCRHALLVGEGPARFLVPLLVSFPNLNVTYLEKSPAMISVARRHSINGGVSLERVDFIAADLRDWQSHGLDADLVATHFFLDCFPPRELERCVEIIGDNLAPTAQWLVSDFRIPEHGLRRFRARLLLKMMYSVFRVVTRLEANRLTPPDVYIEKLGFRLIAQRFFNFGFIHSDYWGRGISE